MATSGATRKVTTVQPSCTQKHSTAIVHEGCKGAALWRELNDKDGKDSAEENGYDEKTLDEFSDHPWKDTLDSAAHVGWVGGALNPNRTDWSPLNKAGINYIYITADNDAEGKSAVPKIAKELRKITFSIAFDVQFGTGFDLADPFPKDLFKQIGDERIYTGPTFQELKEVATWMTDLIPQKKGRPIVALRGHVPKLWASISETGQIICLHMPEKIMTEGVASTYFSRFSDSKNNTCSLIRKKRLNEIVKPCYRPDKKQMIISGEDGKEINVYIGSSIIPIKRSPKPFLDFMKYLIPNKTERTELLRWCATLIARPEIRMGYSVLLFSQEQGVGKTTLASEILKPLIGARNTSFPDETAIQSDFNGWRAHKRLVVVSEIYQGKSWKVYNALKAVITDKDVNVNIKHISAYTIDNWCHVLASSNSPQALKMDNKDRRWFVPEVVEENWTKEQYTKLYQWLATGGLSAIRYWAEHYGDYVSKSEHAPTTDRKQQLIEDSKSEYTKLCEGWAEDHRNKVLVIGTNTLHNYILKGIDKGDGNRRFERSYVARLILDGHAGYTRITKHEQLGLDKQVRVAKGKNKETAFATKKALKQLSAMNNTEDMKQFIIAKGWSPEM